MAILYGGEPQRAIPVCEDAYNLFLSEGNRAGAADAIGSSPIAGAQKAIMKNRLPPMNALSPSSMGWENMPRRARF